MTRAVLAVYDTDSTHKVGPPPHLPIPSPTFSPLSPLHPLTIGPVHTRLVHRASRDGASRLIGVHSCTGKQCEWPSFLELAFGYF